MSIKDHHLLCLGVLANIGIQARSPNFSTRMNADDLKAIREAIDSGQKLGLPVEVKQYDAGQPIHRMAVLK